MPGLYLIGFPGLPEGHWGEVEEGLGQGVGVRGPLLSKVLLNPRVIGMWKAGGEFWGLGYGSGFGVLCFAKQGLTDQRLEFRVFRLRVQQERLKDETPEGSVLRVLKE